MEKDKSIRSENKFAGERKNWQVIYNYTQTETIQTVVAPNTHTHVSDERKKPF